MRLRGPQGTQDGLLVTFEYSTINITDTATIVVPVGLTSEDRSKAAIQTFTIQPYKYTVYRYLQGY